MSRGVKTRARALMKLLNKIEAQQTEVERLRAEVADLERQLREAEADARAVRELMNTYNLGGWTDAVGPMKRALAAEALLREARLQMNPLPDMMEKDGEQEAADLFRAFNAKLDAAIDATRKA